jgi:hypothetical protein
MVQVVREALKSTKLYGVCAFKTFFNFNKENTKDDWSGRIHNNEVRTDYVPLKELLKDPQCTWNTSPWIAHEIIARIDDIAEKFKIRTKKDRITVVQRTKGADELASIPSEFDGTVKSDFKYGRYFEVEDRIKGENFVIIDGIDGFAKKPEAKKYDYDTMYDFLQYNDLPGRPNTFSDYYFWRDQLLEVSTYRTMEVGHARKGTAKYKWRGDAPSSDQMDQVKSSQDSTVVELGNNQDIEPFQHSTLDPQLFTAEQIVRNDIQMISKGAPRQPTGQEKTATEVKAIEFQAQKVDSEDLTRLEEVLASIANKQIQLMQKNYSTTRTVNLTGLTEAEIIGIKDVIRDDEIFKESGKSTFLQFNKEHIAKKVKATIKAGSTLPDNDQTRISKLQAFAQFVSAMQLTPGIDLEQMLDEGAKAFGVENENILIRKDNPSEESRLLNANVYLSPRLTENHDEHLFIHERESNGSDANIAHILGHKLFKKQIDANQQAKIANAPVGAGQLPIGGSSFVGPEQSVPGVPPGQGGAPQGGGPVAPIPQSGTVPLAQ